MSNLTPTMKLRWIRKDAFPGRAAVQAWGSYLVLQQWWSPRRDDYESFGEWRDIEIEEEK